MKRFLLAAIGFSLLVTNLLAQTIPSTQAAPATQGTRLPQQIMGEFAEAAEQLQKIFGSPQTLADGALREAAAPRAIPILKHMGELVDEMTVADPRSRAQSGEMKIQLLSIRSTLGDQEAVDALNKMASGNDAKALSARTAMLAGRWWKAGKDAAAQGIVMDDLEALCRANPDSDAVAGMVRQVAGDPGASRQSRDRAEALLSTVLKGELARQFTEQLLAEKNLRGLTGKAMVISGKQLNGKPFTSADWKGKVVLVDFWASWCAPCLEEIPRLTKIYKLYHEKGLEIVGVSSDQQTQELKDYLAKNPEMAWTQLFDADNPGWHPLARDYGLDQLGIPRMFLIDKKGICRSVEGRSDMEQLIPELLKE